MLEGTFIEGGVVIVVVGVSKEAVAEGQHVGAAEVGAGQLHLLRRAQFNHFALLVAEILADLEAQVGVGLPVADDFHRGVDLHAAVVGGDDDAVAAAGDLAEELANGGVAEPAERDAAEGGLVAH